MKINKPYLFILLFVINELLVFFFELELNFLEVLTIHAFLFSLLFFTDLIQTKISKNKSSIPAIIISVHFFRILVCILFLSSRILNHESANKNYIYNFFFVYFFVLFYEVFLRLKNEKKINL